MTKGTASQRHPARTANVKEEDRCAAALRAIIPMELRARPNDFSDLSSAAFLGSD
jgi:hypothetical protein